MNKAATPPRMLERYQQHIAPELMKRFGHTNRLAVPRLVKIVLNVGCGEAAHDVKALEEAQRDLALLAGQRPVVTRSKQAVSNFKIKEGDPVGCKVTLRRHRMYEFLDRLVSVALPRIRDFRGLSPKGFDRAGNYSFGIQEQSIFPELRLDDIRYNFGMDIAMVMTAKTPEEAKALLDGFGFPFEKDAKG
jgi:large subunit ribosomal protein L5